MLQLTVDLSADKGTLLRVAQLILQFAGYEPPKEQPTVAPVLAAQEQPIPDQDAVASGGDDHGQPDPSQVFATQVPPLADVPPPPSAQATIPDLPPVPPPPPAAGIDVDSRGLPWDPRIHSGTRAKTVNGEWRQKRGTQPMDVARVEAELRQTMGAAVPVPPPPVVVPPVPPAPFAGNAAPPAPPISSTPPVPASAGAAPTASPGSGSAAPATVTFPQLMGAITRGFTAGTIKKDQIDAAIAKVNLPSLPMLASRPDLVGAVATELGLAL